MDWLRRNWPDLLIGVALVAVIAMIVATLLSGGSLASLVRRDTPPEPLITTTGPDTAADTPAPGTTLGATEDSAGDGAADASEAGTPDGYDVFVPGVPGRDDTAGTADGGLQTGGASPDAVAATPADSSQTQATLPEASATGGFRVAAGALDSRDAASATAQGYRDSGFEVTVEQQDDLYLLWVGPYATREDADAAAASIIAGGGDALVYTYSGEGDGEDDGEDAATATPDTTDAPTDTTTGTAQEDAGETAGPSAPNAGNGSGNGAPGGTDGGAATLADAGTGVPTENAGASAGQGQRYLQVGAFVNDESAEPLRAQLEGLDLSVSSSEDASGLVRLYVGPFGNAQLTQTQNRLNAQGIDSFPVVR